MQSFKDQFAKGDVDSAGHIVASVQSPIVAILSAGTVLGALLAAPIGDSMGRRRSLIASVGVFCFGVVFQVLAENIPLLLVGRYVAYTHALATRLTMNTSC
jgi:MFS transporter, SP family, sugar:H+ symporter